MTFKISDFTKSKGLVFCNDQSNVKNNAELLYLYEARKLKIDAVFFRRFFYHETDKKPFNSEPSVCILNRDDNFFNSQDHIDLHAKLWSAGKNEIYIIKGKTRIDIINARNPAKVYKEDGQKRQSLEPIRLATGAIATFDFDQYSSYLFETGTFWEQDGFKNKVDEQTNSYIYLLNHLMKVRKLLFTKNNLKLEHETIDKLLIICILIKFLEEIKDDERKHTLKSIYKKNKVEDFADAIDKNKCLDILNELSSEFNGRIFDKFSVEEKNKIQNSNLSLIAKFIRANIDIDSGQLFLWEQYNFNYLPAEVISSIYENFIQAEATRQIGESEKGVVYTPIHLVNMLVDEVMPLNKPELFKNKTFRILDPACGSGVFLVAAYKRLLQWWALNNSTGHNIQYPNSKEAKRILEENIFGVDVKRTATLVSVFGLTTALLDKLSPQEIWNNLKFSDLNEKNIQENNFFDWALVAKNKGWQFDLSIGNPPFNIETGKKKIDVLKPEVLSELNFKHPDIPNNNFALHFFEGAMLLSKKVCLIIPSNALLYNPAGQKYRNEIFTDFTIKALFDFTHLRRSLFHKTADTPVVAVIAENIPSNKKDIEHTVVKRTLLSEKKLRFEIDYYDRHYVKWSWAIDDSKNFIWKTNLLGGGRLFHLIYRLSLLPTVKDFLLRKKQENVEWIYSSGYKIGGNTKKKLAYFINEGVKIDKINEDGSYQVSKEKEKTDLFEFYPPGNIYTPPTLIIDQILGKHNIPVCLIEEYVGNKYFYFNRDFIGIHAPVEEVNDLRKIYSFIKEKYNKLYQLYVIIRSGSCLVLTETEINKRDIDSLPYPEDVSYLNLSKSEKILQNDVLTYYIHLGKAITPNSAGNILFQPVPQKQLKHFGEVFCDALNAIYAKNNKSWQPGIIQITDSYIVYQIGFGENNGLKSQYDDSFNEEIEKLIEDKISNRGIVYKKIVRFYSSINSYDCVFLIKPNTMRYWLNSTALRDADDTFIDLKEGGF